jgi:general transcription factor 3C polypeptide 5 (transcription factor C subunit 1)
VWSVLSYNELTDRRDHIFDGEILHRDKPDYQLCDIEDSLIKRYINDLRLITDTCTVSSLRTGD